MPVTKPLNDLYKMKVKIEINCETILDLHVALTEVKKQIRKQARINKADQIKDDFSAGTYLTDKNCYGDFELEVFED